eukprot:167455_1
MIVFILLILFTFIKPNEAQSTANYSGWIAPATSTLPRISRKMALVYDDINNRIWILGDQDYARQLVSFDIDTEIFSDHGTNNLSVDTWAHPHYYVQIDNLLYMVNFNDGTNLVIFDIQTTAMSTLSIPTTDTERCLGNFYDK